MKNNEPNQGPDGHKSRTMEPKKLITGEIRAKMSLSVGRIASGPNHWVRQDIVDALLRRLNRSDVSFLGPRRTGKTSILWHIRDRYTTADQHFVYLNVQRYTTEEEWLRAMIEELMKLETEAGWKNKLEGLRAWAGGHLGRLKEIKVMGTGLSVKDLDRGETWQDVGKQLFDLLQQSESKITFMLDEFPELVRSVAKRSPADAAALLGWFQADRQSQDKVSFLVTGSLGLPTVARRYQLTKQINDFEAYRIEPMKPDEARALARRLAADNELPANEVTIEWMLSRIGTSWPYFIQLFLSAIQDLGLPADAELSEVQLEALYETRLLDQTYNSYLEMMWERLSDYFEALELRQAHALLAFTAAKGISVTTDSLRDRYRTELPSGSDFSEQEFRYLLDVLVHDGYLVESDSSWVFSSHLLRDFWNRRTR